MIIQKLNPMLYAGLPYSITKDIKTPPPKNLRIEVINKLVENEFNIDIDKLKIKSRKRDERVLPRQMWQYLIRKHN